MTAVVPIFAPEHRIKSVTIFRSNNLAEIVRTFELELKPGPTRVEISGLPSVLDPESIRVTGLGTGTGSPLRLQDVVCTTSFKALPVGAEHALVAMSTPDFLAKIPASLDPTERIRLLRAHMKTLEAEKHVREHESSLLISYAKTLNGEHVIPEQMSTFLSTFVEAGRKSVVAVRQIEEMMVEVQRGIELEEQKLAKKKGVAHAKVDILIGNGEKDKGETRKIELKLTYIVSNAKWEPTYELHAHTSPTTGQPSSQVTLHYRASITQFTGEDWTDSALTLSSGSSMGGLFNGLTASMPILQSVQIRQTAKTSAVPFTKSAFNTNPVPFSSIFGNKDSSSPSAFGQPVTNNINSFSSFGSTVKASTGAFGYPTAGPSLFGGSAFGTTQPQQQSGSNSSGVSAFGTTQPQQQSNSLFGAVTRPSAFGGSSTSSGSNTTNFAGGLFGSGTSGSLFGAASQPASTEGSTFGSGPAPQPSNTGFGLFGGASTASGGPGLFGAFSSTQQPPQQQQQQQSSAPATQPDSLAEDFEEITVTDPSSSTEERDVPLSQTQTIVTKTPVAISYSVEGLVSIPSDGVKHHVGVAVLPFGGDEKQKKEAGKEDVKIEYGVVPRADVKVYIQCRVKNSSEYTILPGPVAVILNDTYVARTNISHVNPDGFFTCTLGSDSATSVTYTRTSKSVDSAAGSFAESFKITTYTTTVTLYNRHDFDLKEVRVWDAVPMWTPANDADKSRVTVLLRKPQGLADAKEREVVSVKNIEGKNRDNVQVIWAKEKEGKLYWKVNVAAGKSEQLVLEWEVKAPANLALVESYGKSLFGA